MKNSLLILIVFFVFGCTVPKENTFESKEKVMNYLSDIMDSEGIPGLQVAVIKNNEVVLTESLGLANIPFSVAVNEHTIFSINSIAKIFAATAILQLEELSKLSLSDSVSNHLDSLPAQWQSVTIGQLLNHTSGLPDIEDSDKDQLVGGKGELEAWEIVQDMPLQFAPGEAFRYNSTNYLLIQKIIEKISNSSFEAYINDTQFAKADMKYTHYANSFDVTVNKSPTYCYFIKDEVSGEFVKKSTLTESYENFPLILRADAGAFTTASDMVKWIIALQTGSFLKKESIQKMWTPIKLNSGEYGNFEGMLNQYAMGWPVISREQHPGISPFGGGRASFTIYPDDDLVVILFTNLTGIPTFEMVDEIAQFYFIDQ